MERIHISEADSNSAAVPFYRFNRSSALPFYLPSEVIQRRDLHLEKIRTFDELSIGVGFDSWTLT